MRGSIPRLCSWGDDCKGWEIHRGGGCPQENSTVENSQACNEDWPSTPRVLADSRMSSNDIDAQECVACGIKVEAEDQSEELKMADGTMVRTKGQVQFILKCGGYKGEISARVFPSTKKQMILGIPWLSKENRHINWTQAIMVMKKGQN